MGHQKGGNKWGNARLSKLNKRAHERATKRGLTAIAKQITSTAYYCEDCGHPTLEVTRVHTYTYAGALTCDAQYYCESCNVVGKDTRVMPAPGGIWHVTEGSWGAGHKLKPVENPI